MCYLWLFWYYTIVCVCRYEESQLHASIYELHVKLLAADGQTVIKEHSCSPTENLEIYSHDWKQVCLSPALPLSLSNKHMCTHKLSPPPHPQSNSLYYCSFCYIATHRFCVCRFPTCSQATGLA